MAEHDEYRGPARLEFFEIALAEIAPTVAKRVEPDDVDALAQALHRSLHREPEHDVAAAIDAWFADAGTPQALPTAGQVWPWLGEVRRRRAAKVTPSDLFGGPPGAGAPLPGYLRQLEADLADLLRGDLPPHRHRPPGPGIDPTDGCDRCEAAATRADRVDELLAAIPNTQALERRTCRGCDGAGWVLVSGPGWEGLRRGADPSIWDRCPECNPADEDDAA